MAGARRPSAHRGPVEAPPAALVSANGSHSGGELRDMFAAATSWLEVNAEAINSINVFPVPDGDTGTNMYLTMRSTMDEAFHTQSDAAGIVARAMARGALMGARGNSGVILSQILRGMAEGLSGKERFTITDFALALDAASRSAYTAVTKPVEGTILTVIREVATAVKRRAKRLRSLGSLLAAAVEAAREAVAKTPSLLPVLREAGVVDAGGQGLYVMLEGALRYLRGDVAPSPTLAPRDPEAHWLEATASLHAAPETRFGYCTEFLLEGERLDREAVLQKMLSLGDSILVVGDESLLRVHLHASDPGAALSYGAALGTLSKVKVDNIQAQADRFVSRPRDHREGPAAAIGVVVVAAGPGLEEVARSLGATAVVKGGQTMNPSTESILNAVEGCLSPQVIILPNNKNVVLAASQAAQHARKKAVVVPTTTFPQGVAALLALNPEVGVDENVTAMEIARRSVRTAEVTRAVRGATINGLRIRQGQAIALVDGDLCLAKDSVPEAVHGCLSLCLAPDSSLVTLYYGADVSAEEAAALREDLLREHPSLEIELVAGGQPHYHYIVSVE